MGHVSLSISMSDNCSNRTCNDILTKSLGCLRRVSLITLKILRSHYTTLHEIQRNNHYQLWNMHMFQYFMILILRQYWIPVYMRFSLHFLLPFLHWNISNLAPNLYLFLRKQVNFQRNVISHYLHIWRKYNSK